MEREYDDIIDLPRPHSKRHAPMSRADRAAQFAPFAALTGYDAIVRETARLTEEPIELAEDEKQRLDGILSHLSVLLEVGDFPKVTVKYFEPDSRKRGGSYVTLSDELRCIDVFRRVLVLACGVSVRIERIADIIADTIMKD